MSACVRATRRYASFSHFFSPFSALPRIWLLGPRFLAVSNCRLRLRYTFQWQPTWKFESSQTYEALLMSLDAAITDRTLSTVAVPSSASAAVFERGSPSSFSPRSAVASRACSAIRQSAGAAKQRGLGYKTLVLRSWWQHTYNIATHTTRLSKPCRWQYLEIVTAADVLLVDPDLRDRSLSRQLRHRLPLRRICFLLQCFGASGEKHRRQRLPILIKTPLSLFTGGAVLALHCVCEGLR